MLNQFAAKLSMLLIHRYNLDDSKKDIYTYGFKILLSTTITYIIIIMISSIINQLPYTLLFLFIYIGLRLFCNGYHSRTFINCFFSTQFTHLSVIILSQILYIHNNSTLMLTLHVLSLLIISILSPISTIHKKFPRSQYIKNKKRTLFILLFINIAYLSLFFTKSLIHAQYTITISLVAVAFFMLLPMLINPFKNRN